MYSGPMLHKIMLMNKNISTILFADDQVIMSDSEDNLQTAIYKLNKIITEYGLTISTDKSKVMSFKGKDPTRSKIVINNKIIEQVNIFNYLGNLVSYEKGKDIDNKITIFLKITGLINNTFKPNKVQKGTRIKLYTTLALLVLLYGSKT
jgi:flagellin-specific chaperone FliS